MKRSTQLSALGASLVMAVAGCGGDDNDSDSSASKSNDSPSYGGASGGGGGGGGGGAKLALAADPGGKIAFDKKSLSTNAGKTTIAFTNASEVPHAVEVEGKGIEEETKTIQGGKASVTVDLKPGSYTFYCPVADHEQEGMKGTLTAK